MVGSLVGWLVGWLVSYLEVCVLVQIELVFAVLYAFGSRFFLIIIYGLCGKVKCAGGKIEKNEMGGYVARMGVRGEGCTGFWWGNLRERDHWGDADADGTIILRWIFRNWEGVVRTGWSWLRIGTGGGTCESSDETSGSKNAGNFLTSCRTS